MQGKWQLLPKELLISGDQFSSDVIQAYQVLLMRSNCYHKSQLLLLLLWLYVQAVVQLQSPLQIFCYSELVVNQCIVSRYNACQLLPKELLILETLLVLKLPKHSRCYSCVLTVTTRVSCFCFSYGCTYRQLLSQPPLQSFCYSELAANQWVISRSNAYQLLPKELLILETLLVLTLPKRNRCYPSVLTGTIRVSCVVVLVVVHIGSCLDTITFAEFLLPQVSSELVGCWSLQCVLIVTIFLYI